jgi:hypothetical protein
VKQESKAAQDPRSLHGEALREALEELCERKQSLFLATPYLAWESRFMELTGKDLRVRATMSRNTVRHALDKHPLRMRFPWGLTLFGGPTRVLEYEEAENSRYLRIALPLELAPDDNRQAYRVEQVGRSTGALGSQELKLMRINLDNISTGGIGVFCTEPMPATGFQVGRSVNISLSLEQGPQFQAQGRVCHAAGQNLGLCFTPPLVDEALLNLALWIQPRQDEAQRRWEDRASYLAQAARAAQPKAPPSGILLVSADAELKAALELALGGSQPLRTVAPALAPFREAMALQPPYLLVFTATGRVEERHRLKTLLDAVAPTCPLVLIGTGADLEPVRALAAEVKARLFLDRSTIPSPFFQRLILGLIRKHWNLIESP